MRGGGRPIKTPDPTKAESSAPNGIEFNATPTKEEDVLRALAHDSLNRFEAERIGDHCLPTTVSQLQKKGIVILSEWEKVPSRGARGETNVKRYWVAPEPKNLARVRSLLGSEQGGE